MDKVIIEDQKKQIAQLILLGDKLIDRLSRVSKKESLKNKTLDKLSYVQGLKSNVDKMIKKNTDVSLSRADRAYQDYLDQASYFIDPTSVLTKSPSFNINYQKEGIIQNFATDLNIRMASVDINKQIKDLKRVRNALYLKMKKMEREKEQVQINEKFEELKSKIMEL